MSFNNSSLFLLTAIVLGFLILLIFIGSNLYGSESVKYLTLLHLFYISFSGIMLIYLNRAKDKRTLLFALLSLILVLRITPRLANIYSGYMLAPGDEGYDYSAMVILIDRGHLVYELINGHNVEYFQYPMIHIATAILNIVSSIDSLALAVTLPVLLSILSFLYLYLFTQRYLGNSNIVLAVAILLVAYLFAGSHAQYWSTFIREAFAAPFAILTLVIFFDALFRRYFVSWLKILPLVLLVLCFSHYATNIYLITLIIITFTMYKTLIKPLQQDRPEGSLTGSIGKHDSINYFYIILLITNTVYLIYNAFLIRYTTNWIKTIFEEVLGFNPLQVIGNVGALGTRLYIFERLAIYAHYIALFTILSLFYILALQLYKTHDKKYLILPIITSIIGLSYFASLYGRFIPGQGMYPVLRFSPWPLLLSIMMLIHLFRSTRSFLSLTKLGNTKILLVMSILLVTILTGYLAQVSPLFKYREYRLNTDPGLVMKFIIRTTDCKFNLGYEVTVPWVVLENFGFVSLDSQNTICKGIGYFQYSILNNKIIMTRPSDNPLNILVISSKYGGIITSQKNLIFNSCDITLSLIVSE